MKKFRANNNFTLNPLLLLAVSFAAGILIEGAVYLGPGVLVLSITAFTAIAFVMGRSVWSLICLSAAFVALGSFCYYVETVQLDPDRLRALIDGGEIVSGEPVELRGVLNAPPEPTFQGQVLMLSVDTLTYRGENRKASGTVRLYLTAADQEAADDLDTLDLRYGSHIAVACNIIREEQFQNPGVISRTQLLDRQGIDATAIVKSPLLIEKLGDRSAILPLGWIYDMRRRLIDAFSTRFSPSTAGVLTASILGDKYFLDKPTGDVFREGGTFHVLVISGLHITFIGGLLLFVVRTFTRNRSAHFVVVSGTMWAYTMAVGAEPPVVRASVMFTILLFSNVIYRRGSLLNSLGACVLVLLAWRPSDLFNPSFQLTVVSVAAIIGMAFPLIEKLRAIGTWVPTAATPFPPKAPRWLVRSCEMLYWRPAVWSIETSRQIWSGRILKAPYLPDLASRSGQKVAAFLFEGLVVSVVVQIWLLPFLVVYFHRVTPVSVIMNLWVGVVIAAESFTALIAVGLSRISEFFATPFFSITEFLNYLLVKIPALSLDSRWSSWRLPHYSGWMRSVYALYFVPVLLLGLAVWRWDTFGVRVPGLSSASLIRRLRVITCASATALILLTAIIVFHPYSAPRADGRLRIDFLDVGQGDSALVAFPDGTTMLIDGGGRIDFRTDGDEDSGEFVPDTPGIGEAVVSPVLWEKGYSTIDYLLATHADSDHIQGLTDVADNFEIGAALSGRSPAADPEFAALEKTLRRRHIPLRLISRGQTFKFGDTVVEILYPRPDESPGAASANNDSVVVRIVYGQRSILLTGDIEREAEENLLGGGGTLRADVVKVPHHGSRTSSTAAFVEAVRPRYAVISIGRRSIFGHPHREVVERWRAAGVRVMTTGVNGMISVSTDGRDVAIGTFTGQ